MIAYDFTTSERTKLVCLLMSEISRLDEQVRIHPQEKEILTKEIMDHERIIEKIEKM